jgi:hypothetical protein
VLHYHGSLSVHDGTNWQQVAGGELEPPGTTVWARVASGAQSVADLVERVLNVLTHLGVTPAPAPCPQLAAARFMAEALRVGTLFRTGWRVEQGRQWWQDGNVPIEHEGGSHHGVDEVITGLIGELALTAQLTSDSDAADLWFLTGPTADDPDTSVG